jgi:hypothetical protein
VSFQFAVPRLQFAIVHLPNQVALSSQPHCGILPLPLTFQQAAWIPARQNVDIYGGCGANA